MDDTKRCDDSSDKTACQAPGVSLTKTILLHREIHGFLVGGEKRLLFSEINEELCRRGIHRQDIFEKLKNLQMELSEATADQCAVVAAHLGLSDSTPLGEQYLIRQTDAERLCGAVIRSQRLATDADITENTFKVQHEIFGKSRGLFIPELYVSSSSECITCIQCRALLSPQDFVRHNHSPPKNQVRHWGLESTRWWRYVFVAKDQNNREHFQRILEELKHRFSAKSDEVMSLSTTAKKLADSASTRYHPSTTAAVYSQLAALQDAADVVKGQQQNGKTAVAAVESFLFLHQQRQRIVDSLRECEKIGSSNSGNKGYTGNETSSFADVMASAMAAAVAVASSQPKSYSGQLSSAFVPPPNIRLQDVMKTRRSELDVINQRWVNKDRAHEYDSEHFTAFVPSKRRRIDDVEAADKNCDSSDSPGSSLISEKPAASVNECVTPLTEALAAIRSQARFQSDSAAIMAIPPQILLSGSRPLPVTLANNCADSEIEASPIERHLRSDNDEADDVDGDEVDLDDCTKAQSFDSGSSGSIAEPGFRKDTAFGQHFTEEVDLLKKALIKKLTVMPSCQKMRPLTGRILEVDRECCDTVPSSGTENLSMELEVEKWFQDGLLEDFRRLRSKHHVEVFEHAIQQQTSAGSTPTPKHKYFGKYFGELQEAKNDLEAKVKQLMTELSNYKTDYNTMFRRLQEKEREIEEMRRVFNSILVGSATSTFFTPATTSAVAAALFGNSCSSSARAVHEPWSGLDSQQYLLQRMSLINDKIKAFTSNLDSADTASGNYHTTDELSVALAMASTASSQNKNDIVLSST